MRFASSAFIFLMSIQPVIAVYYWSRVDLIKVKLCLSSLLDVYIKNFSKFVSYTFETWAIRIV